MKKSATIEDVKKAKIAVESDILKQVVAFEKDYGVRLSYISIQRENDNRDTCAPSRPDAPKYNKPMSVDISMDLDIID